MAVIGKNGSGKSTTLSLFARPVSSLAGGQILLNGNAMADYERGALLSHMMLGFQKKCKWPCNLMSPSPSMVPSTDVYF